MVDIKHHWVTKTDLMNFCRCPYAFSMLQLGLAAPDIPAEGSESEESGSEFPRTLRRFFKRRGWTINWGPLRTVFMSEALRIAGKPHGVDKSRGAMIPVAVFSPSWSLTEDGIVQRPRKLTWRDRWGLAFYWLLLSPYRAAQSASPIAHVVLLTNYRTARAKELDVSLSTEVTDVEFVIEKVRQAKTSVPPWQCGRCDICRGRDGHALGIARDTKSLSLVQGISFRHAVALERFGIFTYEDLLNAVSQTAAQQIGVSRRRLENWRSQAGVVATRRPEVKKALPIDPERMLILDIEHISESWNCGATVWLIGVRIVRDGRAEDHILWAETPSEEWRNLRRLAALFEHNRDLPVVTWNGTSSDLRVLQKSGDRWRAVRAGIPYGWPDGEVANRHVDLFRYVRDDVRLDTARLGLKDVARSFGLSHDPVSVRVPQWGDGPQDVTIDVGKTASDLYIRYALSKPFSRNKKVWFPVRRGLMDYNRQDLAFVSEIATRLKELSATAADRTSGRPPSLGLG